MHLLSSSFLLNKLIITNNSIFKLMELEADSLRNSARKRTRKRPYTRKASLSSSFVNMAEARREIVNALQLHRSSIRNAAVPCTSSYRLHHQLTDSMPVRQPTWSTTVPAVPCAPIPTVEVLEVEWFDNISASYSWWMGFLSSLDRKKGGDESAERSGGSVPCLDVEITGSGRDDQSPFTDDWIAFSPADGCGDQQL